MDLGRNIQAARVALGHTQGDLASLAGVDRAVVIKLENKGSVNVNSLRLVSKALGITLSESFLSVAEMKRHLNFELLPRPSLEHMANREVADLMRKHLVEAKADRRQIAIGAVYGCGLLRIEAAFEAAKRFSEAS